VLAAVQATENLSDSDTPEGLKHTITGRIQALANVHKLFVESRWTGAELNRLVKEELGHHLIFQHPLGAVAPRRSLPWSCQPRVAC
jgi:two-component sensor histidine kinase